MKRTRLRTPLAPLLVLALALPTALAQQASTVTVALPPATKITYLFPITPSQSESNYNFQVQYVLYKPLLWVGKNIAVNFHRSVADAVTTKDGVHFLIQLNPKWHWSDGKPVTSADLLFFWKLVHSISAKNSSAYYAWGIGGVPQDIRSLTALGPHRLELTTTHPVSVQWLELNGLAQFIPLPKHAWDRYPGHPAKTLAWLQARGNKISFFRKSPVDGPFQVGTFVPDQRYTLLRNPHYSGYQPGYAKLTELYFTSSDAEFNALKAGQVDVGYLPAHLYAQRHVPGVRFASKSVWGFYYIYLNFLNPASAALRSLTVRQALQMAIDQPAMVKVIFHGQAVSDYGPVPYRPSTYLSNYLKSQVPYPYDPAAGKKLLLAHGWKLVGGVMQKGGQRLSFTLQYASGTATMQQQAELFAQAAAEEGVKIRLKPSPFDTILGELGSVKAWTMVYWGGWTYQPDYYPTGDGIFNTGGGSNQEGYSSKTIDRLIQQTTAYAKTKAAAQAALSAYQNAFAKRLPVLFLPVNNQLLEVSSRVHGVLSSYNSTVTNWSPQDWILR
jgi:peptide/nickel transport system substrate-binding protein